MIFSFKNLGKNLKELDIKNDRSLKEIRFIVDAQLPKKLSDFLSIKGFDSIHTLDFPKKNATTDKYIKELSLKEDRILISKDDDFLHSYLIDGKPRKLILVKTGNISNTSLINLFEMGFEVILSLINNYTMIEITKEEIVIHN